MKFLKSIIRISSCPSRNLTYPCGAPSIPRLFYQLFYQYPMYYNQQPKGDGTTNILPIRRAPVAEDLSYFSPVNLFPTRENILYEHKYDSSSQHPSEYALYLNRISGKKGLYSNTVNLPIERHSDNSSLFLCDDSNDLLNANSYGTRPLHKIITFIETKVTTVKLLGLNLISTNENIKLKNW